MQLNLVMLEILILAALWTVMTRSLLRSAIGLALTSAILTVIMFQLGSSLAAVFELSVCSGLISVLFISTISLTEPLTQAQKLQHMKDRIHRFWYLPVIVILAGLSLAFLKPKFIFKLPVAETESDVRLVMWHLRQFDLLGEVLVLLAGVFGVAILFKERQKNG